jgi:hypothetical protein
MRMKTQIIIPPQLERISGCHFIQNSISHVSTTRIKLRSWNTKLVKWWVKVWRNKTESRHKNVESHFYSSTTDKNRLLPFHPKFDRPCIYLLDKGQVLKYKTRRVRSKKENQNCHLYSQFNSSLTDKNQRLAVHPKVYPSDIYLHAKAQVLQRKTQNIISRGSGEKVIDRR